MITRSLTNLVFDIRDDVKKWVNLHLAGFFIFDVVVLILVLLNGAQYFKPFLYISINTIFFLSLILAILLLSARSKAFFLVSVFFIFLSAFLRVLKIDVWADRASIYFFQSFFVGVFLLLIDH